MFTFQKMNRKKTNYVKGLILGGGSHQHNPSITSLKFECTRGKNIMSTKSQVTLSKACHVGFQYDFSSKTIYLGLGPKTPQCKPKATIPSHFGPIRD